MIDKGQIKTGKYISKLEREVKELEGKNYDLRYKNLKLSGEVARLNKKLKKMLNKTPCNTFEGGNQQNKPESALHKPCNAQNQGINFVK